VIASGPPRKTPPLRPMKIRDATFDLHKAGVERLDWRDPYYLAVTITWPMFAGLSFGGLVVVNAIFALLYILAPGAVQNLPPGDLARAFFFSLETLSTVGYGEMAPQSIYGHCIAGIEMVVGMAWIAIFTGLLFVRFSKAQSKILFAKKIVIAPYNGTPTLMVRIANGRMTMLSHASASLVMLVSEHSSEGHQFRSVYDLKLVRDNMPMFPLTWTMIHIIDETSPLHGLGAKELQAQDARIFLAVEARDAALGQVVQDLTAFQPDQIAFGHRYVDAVTIDEHGRTAADLSLLSLVVKV
jgi:inward rectifier potassium channel